MKNELTPLVTVIKKTMRMLKGITFDYDMTGMLQLEDKLSRIETVLRDALKTTEHTEVRAIKLRSYGEVYLEPDGEYMTIRGLDESPQTVFQLSIPMEDWTALFLKSKGTKP